MANCGASTIACWLLGVLVILIDMIGILGTLETSIFRFTEFKEVFEACAQPNPKHPHDTNSRSSSHAPPSSLFLLASNGCSASLRVGQFGTGCIHLILKSQTYQPPAMTNPLEGFLYPTFDTEIAEVFDTKQPRLK